MSAGSSINYALDNKVVNISDRDGSLKSFVDKHTKSGNEVIVWSFLSLLYPTRTTNVRLLLIALATAFVLWKLRLVSRPISITL